MHLHTFKSYFTSMSSCVFKWYSSLFCFILLLPRISIILHFCVLLRSGLCVINKWTTSKKKTGATLVVYWQTLSLNIITTIIYSWATSILITITTSIEQFAESQPDVLSVHLTSLTAETATTAYKHKLKQKNLRDRRTENSQIYSQLRNLVIAQNFLEQHKCFRIVLFKVSIIIC